MHTPMPCSIDCGGFRKHQATLLSPLLVVLLCSFTWDSPCTASYQDQHALCCPSMSRSTVSKGLPDARDAMISLAQVEIALHVNRLWL